MQSSLKRSGSSVARGAVAPKGVWPVAGSSGKVI
jgi:hypothetical protein